MTPAELRALARRRCAKCEAPALRGRSHCEAHVRRQPWVKPPRRGSLPRHGATSGRKWTPTYLSWTSMIKRCEQPRAKEFAHYGAKGVRVCERWHTFENFLADMGERPEWTTLDRINNAKGYEPGNCRWATKREQTLNRAVTRYIEAFGERLPLVIWAERLGVKRQAVAYLIDRKGMTAEAAISALRERGAA